MSYRYLLTLLLLSYAAAACAEKKSYQVSAIAFYNLENLFDADDDPDNTGDDEFTPAGPYNYTKDIYQQKLHNLATVIRQLGSGVTPHGPAIIGVAEVENGRVLEDLIAQPEIRERNYKIVHFESPDSRGIDVGLLYHPGYFTVINARPLHVDISRTGQKGGTTRDILYVQGVLAGDTVHVLVNHWPSRRGGEAASAPLRAIAAGVGRKLIDSLMKARPGVKVVLMGDLNDDPINASVAKVLGAIGDREMVTQKKLYNPWMNFYKHGIGSLAYNDSWNLFDQIIISGGWLQPDDAHWHFYKAEIFNREFLRTSFGRYKGYPHRSFSGNQWINGYSDHFPTIIYLIRTADGMHAAN